MGRTVLRVEVIHGECSTQGLAHGRTMEEIFPAAVMSSGTVDLSLFPNHLSGFKSLHRPACLWLLLLIQMWKHPGGWGPCMFFCDLLRMDTPYSTQMRPPLWSRRRMNTNANLQKVPFSHRCQIKFPANPFREGQCSFSIKCGFLNSM